MTDPGKPKERAESVWIPCERQLPKNGQEVMTKIDDDRGCRNDTSLKRQGNLWFFPDMSMYVYYMPTHWKEVEEVTHARR